MVNPKTVSKQLEQNKEAMESLFHIDNNVDLITREFVSGFGRRYYLVCMDGMVNSSDINDFILRPLMNRTEPLDTPNVIQILKCDQTDQMNDAVTAVLNGDTVVFEEDAALCTVCETKGFATRSVSNPTTETVVKGSQEAFTEAIRTNITLMRRIIKSNTLCTEFISVGDVNKDLCAVMYLDGIVNREILDEVRRRLNEIKGDLIMGNGMVEQLIEDKPFSLFPSVISTERPDRVANYLSRGRVAVICDGSPFVIVVPISISLLLDSPECNTQRWYYGTFSRLIRIIAFLATTMLSGIYVAMVMYHREMIPTQLLSAIVSARANIPFPSVVEVLVMELFFELVREAGLRTPNALGGTIGIVGALILGQSAVEANLVSPVTLIVVAISGLCNTALPDYDLAFGLRVIKALFILFGAMLGFLGIVIAMILVLTMLSNQYSFGVSMLSIQTLRWGTGTPILYQLPLFKQRSRPRELHPEKTEQSPARPRGWDHGAEKEC